MESVLQYLVELLCCSDLLMNHLVDYETNSLQLFIFTISSTVHPRMLFSPYCTLVAS